MTNKLENIAEGLHKLNFGEGGPIEFGEDYCFKRFEGEHTQTDLTVCKTCDRYLQCEKGKDENKGLSFTRITHGTHTLDFLDAHNVGHDTVSSWSQKPVLFVMENPGAVDDGDLQLDCGRYISKKWYWIMGQCGKPNADFIYPNYFIHKEYGWMIYSVIRTFKIANAYVTNMVKCGMKSDEKNYLTTDEYPDGIAQRCVENYLKRELDCLREGRGDEKVIVFAFGERTYYRLAKELDGENISLYLLPHPANRLANDYRKYVLFGKILRALLQNHFYEGVKKTDFGAILAADKEKEPKISREEFCKTTLETILKGKANLLKRKSYAKDKEDTSICYDFVYLKDPQGTLSDEPEKLILRQRLKQPFPYTLKDRKYNFKVSWVEYNFRTKEIRLFAGTGETANVWVEDRETDEVKNSFPILGAIEAFAQKYQDKYESPDSPD